MLRSTGGSLRGNQHFRAGPIGSGSGYLNNPNADQREFNRQLQKMNPDVAISVPIHISQAREDQRVQYAPPRPRRTRQPAPLGTSPAARPH